MRFKYIEWLNSSIWHIDESLIVTTNISHSGHGSNVNKRVLHIPQISRAGISPADNLGMGTYPSAGAADVFYSPSQLGSINIDVKP